MTHPDADTILKFSLQLLDEPESLIIREHLTGCMQCSDLLSKALGDVARLENIAFDVNVPAPPRLHRQVRKTSGLWRWAAVLATGFLLGYMTSNLSEAAHPIPVPQHMVPTTAREDHTGFVPCQAVDVKAAYEAVR